MPGPAGDRVMPTGPGHPGVVPGPPPAAAGHPPAVPHPMTPPAAPAAAPPVAPPPGPWPAPAKAETPPAPETPTPTAPPPVVTIVDPDSPIEPDAEIDAEPFAVTPTSATSSGEAPREPPAPPPGEQPAPDQASEPEQEKQPATAWRATVRLAIEDRPSTEEEQRRFAAALGARFNELLASVNAGIATWPALRVETSPGAKADLAAVCLYLGGSGEGAAGVDAALRAGAGVAVEAYLPCLASGIGRLPLHRRPVVRQARLGQPARRLYPVGSVVAEPGFLCASAATDAAVPDSDVDFLVWPAAARQVRMLAGDRDIDEVVFAAAGQFKVLGVDESGDGERALPRTAVLLRELKAHEQAAPGGLDEADRAALARLTNVLRRRRGSPPRLVDDPELAARLAGPPIGYAADPDGPDPAVGRP
jgi:hypothetical protein